MNEIGVRIVAHAAAMQGESRSTKCKRVHAGHAQVDRLRVNVQAVLRTSGGMSAKRFVRSWSAVTANDVNLGSRMPDRRGEIREDIVKPRVEVANVVRLVIAQEIIEFR